MLPNLAPAEITEREPPVNQLQLQEENLTGFLELNLCVEGCRLPQSQDQSGPNNLAGDGTMMQH